MEKNHLKLFKDILPNTNTEIIFLLEDRLENFKIHMSWDRAQRRVLVQRWEIIVPKDYSSLIQKTLR